MNRKKAHQDKNPRIHYNSDSQQYQSFQRLLLNNLSRGGSGIDRQPH